MIPCPLIRRAIVFSIGLLFIFNALPDGRATAGPASVRPALADQLSPLLGPNDAVAVIDPEGGQLVSIHADRLLVPASILKTLTALAALHYLGKDYRFSTDFFITPDNHLIVKGYGDPLLVSERIGDIADRLATRITRIAGLILDDSYFSYPIVIPGRNNTLQPYDAPNGALCVNFNTVNFRQNSGHWESAEPQTPLLPFAITKIRASGQKEGRITLAADRREILQYSGEMFLFFLGKRGIDIPKGIVWDAIPSGEKTLLWRYTAPNSLQDVVAALLEFSNNFIANQLMLAMGAAHFGPPGTMEKGLQALRSYYTTVLGAQTGHIAEASGLSRDNRISANTMLHILHHFQPYHGLMRREGRQWYKTGTLNGVSTRAGYLSSADGGHYRFVVMINTPGKRSDRVLRLLERALK